jgi:hypothetical protein
MVNMGKPLILALGALVVLASIVLACRPAVQVLPDMDGREYAVDPWTGRLSARDPAADSRLSR